MWHTSGRKIFIIRNASYTTTALKLLKPNPRDRQAQNYAKNKPYSNILIPVLQPVIACQSSSLIEQHIQSVQSTSEKANNRFCWTSFPDRRNRQNKFSTIYKSLLFSLRCEIRHAKHVTFIVLPDNSRHCCDSPGNNGLQENVISGFLKVGGLVLFA